MPGNPATTKTSSKPDTLGTAQEMPLLATKLFIPPARPSLVPRPRLTQRLDAGLALKLILVSAPAGFGKTTLLSEWRTAPPGSDIPLAWVSLDEGDNDPARFWSYVVAALQRIHPGVGEALREMFQAAQAPPAELAMTTLINDLTSFPRDFVLALDDYHVIQTASIHQALAYLLDHLPPQMHLALASRGEPPLPLSRLRGRGQMVEIGAADLRFTVAEAAQFLNHTLHLELTAEQVAALESRTEGWIAGLQMAALSLQSRKQSSGQALAGGQQGITNFIETFDGSHRYIVDYLLDEVLRHQPEAIRAFLQQTAVLSRLCAPLCDALTGQQNGQAMLEQLEAANLFLLPLDDVRQWYRYHHLFGEALQKRLQQAEPEGIKGLHRRAAVWYEERGLIVEAVEHALAAADFATAVRLMEQIIHILILEQGQWETALRWLQALPEPLLHSRPLLCIEYAAILSQTTVDLSGMEHYLQHAEEALRQAEPAAEVQHLRGRIATGRVNIAAWRVDVPEALAQLQLALQLLPEADAFHRFGASSRVGLAYALSGDVLAAERIYVDAGKHIDLTQAAGASWGYLQLTRGHLHRAREILGQSIERQRQTQSARGIAQVFLAEVLYEWNELDATLPHLLAAQQILKQMNLVNYLAQATYLLACVYLAQGERKHAADTMQQLGHLIPKLDTVSRKLIRGGSYPPGSAGALQVHLQMRAAQGAAGNLSAASRWAQASSLTVHDEPNYPELIDHLALARVCLAQGQPEAALRLLPRLLQQAESHGRMRDAIQILALQALALQAQGSIEPARQTLQQALALAEPEGYIRTFVDEGQPMRELLLQVGRFQVGKLGRQEHAPISMEYLDRLLAAFGATSEQASQPAEGNQLSNLQTFQLSNSQLAEPLSPREMEVLGHISEGLSNQQIAEKLYLSLSTVKSHINAIFGKLNVHNRALAVLRARELGLVSP